MFPSKKHLYRCHQSLIMNNQLLLFSMNNQSSSHLMCAPSIQNVLLLLLLLLIIQLPGFLFSVQSFSQNSLPSKKSFYSKKIVHQNPFVVAYLTYPHRILQTNVMQLHILYENTKKRKTFMFSKTEHTNHRVLR